jgi:glycine dehydrogenase
MKNFNHPDQFVNRHIGPDKKEILDMLHTIGVNTVDELIDETIPADIRLQKKLALSEPLSEYEFLTMLKDIAQKNKVFKSYIGMGYHPVITPPVIQRNILENPGWYTQYTPYQAEISQGRLEALLNFQTMIIDLTGMNIANASLLDEGTAAAEAMSMFYSLRKPGKTEAKTFFVSNDCFPQTIDVLKTRANPLGIDLLIGDHKNIQLDDKIYGILLQYPVDFGEAYDYKDLIEQAHKKNIFTIVASDLLSLTLLTPPGEFGADAVVGNTQDLVYPWDTEVHMLHILLPWMNLKDIFREEL